jgi:glycosyltransferase involved in cell wall biosynthesis
MSLVLHIIDRTTHRDMLELLSLTLKAGDRVICLGSEPDLTGLHLPVEHAHEPMSIAALGGAYLAMHEHVCADVVHAWSPRAAQASEAFASKSKSRVVASMPYCPPKPMLQQLVRLAGRGCVLTFPTSAAVEQAIRQGAPSGNVRVLPPSAVAPQDKHARRSRLREKLAVADNHHLLVMMGQIDRDCGFRLGPWVQAILHEIRDDVRLMIAGSGDASGSLERFISLCGQPDEVFVGGWRYDSSDVLSAADVMLHLPVGRSGVRPLSAGMAAGLPVVSSCTAEAAQIGGDAVLFAQVNDPRDSAGAVLQLLDDTDKARALGQAAALRARMTLSPQAAKDVLDAIYEQVHYLAATDPA